MGLLELVIRVFSTILALLILARLDGPRQVAQMNFYDYVVGIAVGSIAGSTCISDSVPLWSGIAAIAMLFLTGIFMSWLSRKNMALRRFLSGKPIMLISHGELQWDGFNRARMNINELLSKLRYSGYFDIGQVDYAVMEPTGDLSVQPKGFARPPKADELNVQTASSSILANVIEDGSIITGNLQAYGKDAAWLKDELKRQGIQNPGKIGLATLDTAGKLSVYLKYSGPDGRTAFM